MTTTRVAKKRGIFVTKATNAIKEIVKTFRDCAEMIDLMVERGQI